MTACATVVGLTGGIATGKSTVSTLFRAHGVPIIDADVLARAVVEPGTPALAAIVRAFGAGVLTPDGALDRPALGRIVFADEAKRKTLNAIVHPAVRRAMFWAVLRHWWRGERVCVLDVPLLIEGGLWKWVGRVVVVYWCVHLLPPSGVLVRSTFSSGSSAEIQLQRLMKRDSSSREDASARLNAQLPIAEKIQYADIVLDNSGSPQDLERQVEQLVQRLKKEVSWSWRAAWLFPPFGVAAAFWTLGWRALRRSQKAKSRRR